MAIDYSDAAAVAAAVTLLNSLAADDPIYGVTPTGDKVHYLVYQKSIGTVTDVTKNARSEGGLTSARFQLDQAIDFFSRKKPPPSPIGHSIYGVAVYGTSYYG